ncbi:hypothetical protein [Paenibacillus validus]|uniref:hypothetical protein n=1 Tax=Paenibacillus validus TaxID=44253 RepID=UPI003D282CB9
MDPNVQRIVIEKQDSNGLATAALVCGIIGLVLGLIPFFGWFMLPLWVLAIIFGYIGMKKPIKAGMAKAGLIIGVITVVYKFGFWILFLMGLAGA